MTRKTAKPDEHVCNQCKGPLVSSEPTWCDQTFNVDLSCPTHGKQFTISTRTDL